MSRLEQTCTLTAKGMADVASALGTSCVWPAGGLCSRGPACPAGFSSCPEFPPRGPRGPDMAPHPRSPRRQVLQRLPPGLHGVAWGPVNPTQHGRLTESPHSWAISPWLKAWSAAALKGLPGQAGKGHRRVAAQPHQSLAGLALLGWARRGPHRLRALLPCVRQGPGHVYVTLPWQLGFQGVSLCLIWGRGVCDHRKLRE